MPLLLDLAESEFPQKLFVNIRGQIGFRVCGCDLCNRPAHALVCRSCQQGVDVARIRPAEYDCHARDLSALDDLVSHNREAGNSVFSSVITPFCQMKAWAQLPCES
jgi:hypothetical protein